MEKPITKSAGEPEIGGNYADQFGKPPVANQGLWHPTIVRPEGNDTLYMLNGVSRQVVIDIYYDGQNDYLSYAEGEEYLESIRNPQFVHDHYEFKVPGSRDRITMTATDEDGNTSEFSLPDGDADGLADTWETTTGIDLDGDGHSELVLPKANRTRPDLYVQYDAMAGWGPVAGVTAGVESVFAARGITLHLEPGNQAIAPTTFDAPTWPKFHAVKEAHFAGGKSHEPELYAAKRLAYRYVLFAVTHAEVGSSGMSELIGNDSMITLGKWFKKHPDGTYITAAEYAARSGNHELLTARIQGGTLLHEFGHALGLGHKGPYNWNNSIKQNVKEHSKGFLSVMNYLYQAPGGKRYIGPQITEYSEDFPDEWGNLWFGFQDHPHSVESGDDISTLPPDDEITLPELDPSVADLYPLIFAPTNTPISVGSPTAVSIAVANTGPATAVAATFTLTISEGLIVSSATTTQGILNISGNTVTVSFGDIESFDIEELTLSLTPTRVETFILNGVASTTTVDGLPENNRMTFALNERGVILLPTMSPSSPHFSPALRGSC